MASTPSAPSADRPPVLIGFAEALPAAETLFSLRAAGHPVRFFARRGARAPVLKLADGPTIFLTPPERDAAATVAELRAAVTREVVMPLDDAGLWLVEAAFGMEVGAPSGGHLRAGASGAQARLALDKTLQIEAARRAGLSVPETLVAQRLADLDAVERFPCILKPALAADASSGWLHRGGARYAERPADLADPAWRAGLDWPLLVQPLTRGIGEGVFGFAAADGVHAWSGHRRLRMMNPHGSGSSACEAAPPDAALRAACADFIAQTGWRGPFMLEFLRDAAGTPWFMELNGRMWGSLALARRQGLEYPAWAVAAAVDPDFTPPAPSGSTSGAPPVRVRHLGRELLRPLFVLRGPKTAFHRADWPRFWPALAAALRPGPARGFYNHDPVHPRHFLRDAWHTLRMAIMRRG